MAGHGRRTDPPRDARLLEVGEQEGGPAPAGGGVPGVGVAEGGGRVVERARGVLLKGREDFPVERIYRDVRVCRIYEGANDIQRLIIGRDIAAN